MKKLFLALILISGTCLGYVHNPSASLYSWSIKEPSTNLYGWAILDPQESLEDYKPFPIYNEIPSKEVEKDRI